MVLIHIKKEIKPELIEGFNPVFNLLPYGAKMEDFVFFDIETTGFDPSFSRYAMTGMFYFADNKWYVEQFLTENREDEKTVLRETNNALMFFKHIVTYNGNDFDIPYLTKKFERIDADGGYLKERSLDLYPLTKKLKKKYNFVNCKLKTIEKHLGIKRRFFIEGDLLATYYMRSVEGSKEHFDEYMGYNEEDVIYLAQLMSDFAQDYFKEEKLSNQEEVEQLSLF